MLQVTAKVSLQTAFVYIERAYIMQKRIANLMRKRIDQNESTKRGKILYRYKEIDKSFMKSKSINGNGHEHRSRKSALLNMSSNQHISPSKYITLVCYLSILISTD